jgi:hypothetical protein
MDNSEQSSKLTSKLEEIVPYLLLGGWIAWQLWGLEAMWPPWEDETDFVLPGANWSRTAHFAIPQWNGFFGAEAVWRWHMPLFPVLMAFWLKAFGTSLVSIRLFTLIPAACVIGLASELCFRISRWGSPKARLFWWVLLLSDKTFIMNAVAGRMEFHTLGFTLLSFVVAFTARSAGQLLLAGLFIGVAIGFHPLAAYFYPALCMAAIMRFPTWRIRCRAAFLAGIGVAIPCLIYAAWFLVEPSASASQFLTVIRYSSSPIRNSFGDLVKGIYLFYGFQPALLLASLLAVGVAAADLKTNDIRKKIANVLLIALIGYIAFLFRGSAGHFYFYVPLAIILYLTCSNSLPPFEVGRVRVGHVLLAALLLNNIVFVGVKSWVVRDNRSKLDPKPMEDYLRGQLKDARRVVVPPNLWLFAFNQKLDFRLLFTPISRMPEAVCADYGAKLLKWRPEVVVIDECRLPPHEPSLTAKDLLAAGYAETGQYERVFSHGFRYEGYRLRVFRIKPGSPE